MPLLPPVAVALPPGQPVERVVTNYPAAAVDREILVTYRGMESDVSVGLNDCRYKDAILSGPGAIFVWTDLCGRWPRVRMISTRYVRVSIHGFYEIRKGGASPSQDPVEETPLDLRCTLPDGTPVEVEVVAFARRLMGYGVRLRGPVTP